MMEESTWSSCSLKRGMQTVTAETSRVTAGEYQGGVSRCSTI